MVRNSMHIKCLSQLIEYQDPVVLRDVVYSARGGATIKPVYSPVVRVKCTHRLLLADLGNVKEELPDLVVGDLYSLESSIVLRLDGTDSVTSPPEGNTVSGDEGRVT